jgi:hypothetical protein
MLSTKKQNPWFVYMIFFPLTGTKAAQNNIVIGPDRTKPMAALFPSYLRSDWPAVLLYASKGSQPIRLLASPAEGKAKTRRQPEFEDGQPWAKIVKKALSGISQCFFRLSRVKAAR